jgi:hypothetical protein
LAVCLFCFIAIPSIYGLKRKIDSALNDSLETKANFQSLSITARQDFINSQLPVDQLSRVIAHSWLLNNDSDHGTPDNAIPEHEPSRRGGNWKLLAAVNSGYAWARTMLIVLTICVLYALVSTMVEEKWSAVDLLSSMLSAVVFGYGITIWIFIATIADHLSRLVNYCKARDLASDDFTHESRHEQQLALRVTFPGRLR